MEYEEAEKFEKRLGEAGYKRITVCKATEKDDYEYYKAFRDGERVKYQIFFEFWDFGKYGVDDSPIRISVTVLPDSITGRVGRRDLKLSVNWVEKIDKIESLAAEFYELVTKFDEIEQE